VYIPQFLDPFISCRASGLFSELGYCEECCDEHQYSGVSTVSCLAFFWVDARSGITGSNGINCTGFFWVLGFELRALEVEMPRTVFLDFAFAKSLTCG
jgi:hypothetical protein